MLGTATGCRHTYRISVTEVTYGRSGSDGSTDIKQTSNVCKFTLADLRELL